MVAFDLCPTASYAAANYLLRGNSLLEALDEMESTKKCEAMMTQKGGGRYRASPTSVATSNRSGSILPPPPPLTVDEQSKKEPPYDFAFTPPPPPRPPPREGKRTEGRPKATVSSAISVISGRSRASRVTTNSGNPSHIMGRRRSSSAKVVPKDSRSQSVGRQRSSSVKAATKDAEARTASTSSLRSGSMQRSASTNTGMSRKSKLEKIYELKSEVGQWKKENKSLKRTVYSLNKDLKELNKDLKQKGKELHKKEKELYKVLDEVKQEGSQKQASNDSTKRTDDETDDTKPGSKRRQHAGNSSPSEQPPPCDVVLVGSGNTLNWSKVDSRSHVISEKSLSKDVTHLRRKLKKEKEAHRNDEVRLKVCFVLISDMYYH